MYVSLTQKMHDKNDAIKATDFYHGLSRTTKASIETSAYIVYDDKKTVSYLEFKLKQRASATREVIGELTNAAIKAGLKLGLPSIDHDSVKIPISNTIGNENLLSKIAAQFKGKQVS